MGRLIYLYKVSVLVCKNTERENKFSLKESAK